MQTLNLETLQPAHAALSAASREMNRNRSRETFRAYQREAERWHATQDKARAELAAARGWIIGKDFSWQQLKDGRRARSRRSDYCYEAPSGDGRAFDHPDYFRLPGGVPAAIAVHVYAKDFELCRALAAENALGFEPLPASWYYPGGCIAGLYVRVPNVVRLPTRNPPELCESV